MSESWVGNGNGYWAVASRRAFDPSRSLREILGELLNGPLGPLHLPDLAVCLREGAGGEPGAIRIGNRASHPDPRVCRGCLLDSSPPDVEDGAVPLERLPCRPAAGIRIGDREAIGLVTGRPEDLPALRRLAESVVELTARLEVNRRFKERFGRDCWLLGGSKNLVHLDAFLQQTAEVALPVLFRGAPGTGRGDAARWSHLLGSRRDGAFVEVDASVLSEGRFATELLAASAEADGGTLFLAAVDEMDVHLQSRLAGILNSGFGRWWQRQNRSGAPDVRVVASAQAANPDRASHPRLHPALRDELAFLSFDLEPLSSRSEDIDLLARYFLRTYSSASSLPELAGNALRRYDLPGNVLELRRIVARLGALMARTDLTLEDLQLYAPELVAGPGASRPALRVDELAVICARGTFAANGGDRVHSVIERALAYISAQFVHPISLAELAQAALISTSHLSHLFKDQLGLSPIAFLTLVRIEQAKRLLAEESSLSVTQVAERSGFGDLRHFERTFKRMVGMNPKIFRNRQARQPQGSS